MNRLAAAACMPSSAPACFSTSLARPGSSSTRMAAYQASFGRLKAHSGTTSSSGAKAVRLGAPSSSTVAESAGALPVSRRHFGQRELLTRRAPFSFEHISQPAPIGPRSFLGTSLSDAHYLHMCVAPAEVEAAAAELAAIRDEAGLSGNNLLANWRPAIVWEPHPQSCKPDQLQAFKACLAHIDVCSPNHEEAAGAPRRTIQSHSILHD